MTGFADSSSAIHRSFQRDQIGSSGINHRRTCSFKLFELSAKPVGVRRNLRFGARSYDGALRGALDQKRCPSCSWRPASARFTHLRRHSMLLHYGRSPSRTGKRSKTRRENQRTFQSDVICNSRLMVAECGPRFAGGPDNNPVMARRQTQGTLAARRNSLTLAAPEVCRHK